MFCPKCAEKQPVEATRFCTKCGFPTRGVKKLLRNDGQTGEDDGEKKRLSHREKGIRQGVRIMLLGLILLPAYFLLAALFPPDDRLVESSPSTTWFEQIGSAILWMTFLAGAARIAYALVFGSREEAAAAPASETPVETTKQINAGAAAAQNALPPGGVPISAEYGRWKTTGDLFERIYRKPKTTSGELR